MENYVEINVSRNGVHFFATAKRSARTLEQAVVLIMEIKKRFPESEGFDVSATEWRALGSEVDIGKKGAKNEG